MIRFLYRFIIFCFVLFGTGQYRLLSGRSLEIQNVSCYILLLTWTFKKLSENFTFKYKYQVSVKQPPEMFYKKSVLRNSTKFTGKHLCQSLFFNKVADLSPATLLKNRFWHRCFLVNFVKFLRTPFYRTPLDDCFCQY